MNKCETCGKSCKRRWCSQACNATSRKKCRDRSCEHCNKSFYVRPSEIKKGGGRFCSNDCRRTFEAIRSPWYEKKGTVAVHRLVAEQMLGRKLKKGETVHHIDGNRRNNLPDNLMVFQSHSEHLKYEARTGQRRITHAQAVANGKRSGEVRRAKKAHAAPHLA